MLSLIRAFSKLTDDLALNIALGNIDPISHKRLLNLRDFAVRTFNQY